MRTVFISSSLLLLAACGGLGSVSSPDPVTHVYLVETIGGSHEGWTSWSAAGDTSIELLASLRGRRLWVLRHELFHLLTHIEGHPNPPDCISSDIIVIAGPCPEEAAQANAAGRVVEISFPDDPGCALDAAAWWNAGLGREAVRVVP